MQFILSISATPNRKVVTQPICKKGLAYPLLYLAVSQQINLKDVLMEPAQPEIFREKQTKNKTTKIK